jgi:hypothetical protein
MHCLSVYSPALNHSPLPVHPRCPPPPHTHTRAPTASPLQAALKAEPLEITYSYYNGAGHRRQITVAKGDTVGRFLKGVQEQLAQQFREMRCVWLHGGWWGAGARAFLLEGVRE